jgi:hypothetical protein
MFCEIPTVFMLQKIWHESFEKMREDSKHLAKITQILETMLLQESKAAIQF